MLRRSVVLCHAVFDVGAEGHAVGRCAADGEDHFGPACGELPPAGRGAGLEEHRAHLWASRHGQRAFGADVFAGVVGGMDAVRVGEDAGVAVQHQRIFVPAFP